MTFSVTKESGIFLELVILDTFNSHEGCLVRRASSHLGKVRRGQGQFIEVQPYRADIFVEMIYVVGAETGISVT